MGNNKVVTFAVLVVVIVKLIYLILSAFSTGPKGVAGRGTAMLLLLLLLFRNGLV